jgi:hypothetical protein
MSNPEIAARLFISARTVQYHLARCSPSSASAPAASSSESCPATPVTCRQYPTVCLDGVSLLRAADDSLCVRPAAHSRAAVPGPEETTMARDTSAPGPDDRTRDTLGGPDPGGREDEIGGPAATGAEDTFGGPDPGGREDEIGGPAADGSADTLNGPDPGWEDVLSPGPGDGS